MERFIFDGAINTIEMLSARKYTFSQKEFFFSKLEYISDGYVKKILEDYIEQVPIPVNIVGYFKSSYRKKYFEEKSKPVAYHTDSWSEYTPKQQAMFFKVVAKMMILNHVKQIDYNLVCRELNSGWIRFDKILLDKFMEDFLEALDNGGFKHEEWKSCK